MLLDTVLCLIMHDARQGSVHQLEWNGNVLLSFHAGMASLYSLVLVVSAWVWRIRNEREGEAEKEGEETPSKHLIV